MQLFSNKVLAMIDNTMYMYRFTYKKLYRIWMHKQNSWKSIENIILLVFVVTSYTEKFQTYKRSI